MKVIFAFIFTTLLIAVVGYSLFFRQDVVPPPPSNSHYLNKDMPVELRVKNLVSLMTLEEKIGQMTLVEKGSIKDIDDISKYEIGALLSGGGGKPEVNTKENWREMILGFKSQMENTRLHIPILYGLDANHGNGNVPGSVVFPHFIGVGAAHDSKLMQRMAEVTAIEMKAIGADWIFSPTLDVAEDMRWGRMYETYSDREGLVSTLAVSFIKGVQSNGVIATAKHFIGVGSMEWGSSLNTNFKIDQGITEDSEKKLREQYLPPFKEAVDAGVLSVMVGLNQFGDEKVSASKRLITNILKEELGFEGFVVSDWYGVYEIAENKYDATVMGINAGIDMVMLPYEYKRFQKDVVRAVQRGDISEERINDAVSRIVRAKFMSGLFDEQEVTDLSVVGSVEHRLVAQKLVAKSMVLLKNNGGILPLSDNVKRIFVSGSAANNTGIQSGGWTVEWQGVEGNNVPGATSILEGIQQRAPQGVLVSYDVDGVFPQDRTKADVGIAVVGEKPYAEGWGDNENPTISPEDIKAINNLRKVSEKVVVILIAGRPLIVSDQISQWDALVMGWLPGSEGQGISDVLFGDVPFEGKLPVVWPRKVGLPVSNPLFESGFGL